MPDEKQGITSSTTLRLTMSKEKELQVDNAHGPKDICYSNITASNREYEPDSEFLVMWAMYNDMVVIHTSGWCRKFAKVIFLYRWCPLR